MDNEKNINQRVDKLEKELNELSDLFNRFLIGYNEDLRFQGETAEEILKLMKKVKSLDTTTQR